MRAIKLYSVPANDFDDRGRLKPDAELMPLYAEQYKYKPGMRREVYNEPFNYDNNTNVHPGRHVNLYEIIDGRGYLQPPKPHKTEFIYDENGDIDDDAMLDADVAGLAEEDSNRRWLLKNARIQNRGASALGWLRGRGKYDNVFGNWQDFDIMSDKETEKRQQAEFMQQHPEIAKRPNGKYELHTVQKFPATVRKSKNNKESELNRMRNIIMFGEDSNMSLDTLQDMLSGDLQDYEIEAVGKLGRKLDIVRLPFIVDADEDDIVSFADVLERGYDPTRDFGQEVQLKNIRARTLPSGMVLPYEDALDLYGEDKVNKWKNRVFNNANGKKLVYARPDWDKWLEQNFKYDDSRNISDKHMKRLIRDVAADIRRKRNG